MVDKRAPVILGFVNGNRISQNKREMLLFHLATDKFIEWGQVHSGQVSPGYLCLVLYSVRLWTVGPYWEKAEEGIQYLGWRDRAWRVVIWTKNRHWCESWQWRLSSHNLEICHFCRRRIWLWCDFRNIYWTRGKMIQREKFGVEGKSELHLIMKWNCCFQLLKCRDLKGMSNKRFKL